VPILSIQARVGDDSTVRRYGSGVATVGVFMIALSVSGCSHQSGDAEANDICKKYVPGSASSSATTVGFIRHFKTGIGQPRSPFADEFSRRSDDETAAWCWRQDEAGSFNGYAATWDYPPVLVAVIESPKAPPTGAPRIL
jgi:hypothetical protein